MHEKTSVINPLNRVLAYIKAAHKTWLFLDYDGTLADFADTPDQVIPDGELIELIKQLVGESGLHISIISGRRLAHIEALLPVEGLTLAGTYGLEIRLSSGAYLQQVDMEMIKPSLVRVKMGWQRLVEGLDGFYLEDKLWSLALHARYASQEDADEVIEAARKLCEQQLDENLFKILGGKRFIEAAPQQASKAITVRFLLDHYALENSAFIYIGDDDKDEEAFTVIQERGGIAIAVLRDDRKTSADICVTSPDDVRIFLRQVLKQYENRS